MYMRKCIFGYCVSVSYKDNTNKCDLFYLVFVSITYILLIFHNK